MQILIIDDERNVVSLVRSTLEAEGFQCSIAYDGEEGLRKFQQQQPDVVLLDLGLPGISGLEVCTRIRQSKTVLKDPYIIMLTARGTEYDRIVGFSTGADDYIPKPFSPEELVVRVRAVLRRQMRLDADQSVIETPHFRIDLERREVLVDREDGQGFQAAALTVLEFDLLVRMASRPKRIWSRSELMDAVRGQDFFGDERAIDSYIRRLRTKISPVEGQQNFIRTHYGAGYSFEDE